MKTRHPFIYKYYNSENSFYYYVNITYQYKRYGFYFPAGKLGEAIKKRDSFLKSIGGKPNPYRRFNKTPHKNKKSGLPAGISFFTLTLNGKKEQHFEITAGRYNGKLLQKRIKICKERTYEKGLEQAIKIRADFEKLKLKKSK